ncbi:MAG: hypothetical protein ACP5FL_05240 [Thermoplasmatota archaeon]
MEEIELEDGIACIIRSQDASEEPLESIGVLEGFTYIGKDEALCIRLGEEHGDLADKIRIIPVGNIACIDLLDQSTQPSSTIKPDHYFG